MNKLLIVSPSSLSKSELAFLAGLQTTIKFPLEYLCYQKDSTTKFIKQKVEKIDFTPELQDRNVIVPQEEKIEEKIEEEPTKLKSPSKKALEIMKKYGYIK